MPNDYFKFKQFLIKQDRCAMKVCTDSCLFGAWAPVLGKKRILDIGTGTGLLSLMIAQRSPAHIDALEIDPLACQQARENVERSPWSTQIQVLEEDFKNYCPQQAANTYDLIVCNPPFYENHWKTTDPRVNTARHSEYLQPKELLEGSAKLLKKEGELLLLLPAHSQETYIDMGNQLGMQLVEILEIRNTPRGRVFRWIVKLSNKKEKIVCLQKRVIVIKEENGNYTAEFEKYLSPYYLAL